MLKRLGQCPRFYLCTDDIPASQRVGFWEKHLATLGFGGTITPHDGHAFRAQASGRPFGRGCVLVFERTDCAYQRSDTHCLSDLGKSFALLLLLRGSVTVEQYGRHATLSPGDCCLINAAMPLSGENRDARIAALIYDRDVVARWLPNAQAVCGIALSQGSPWGKALSAAMTALSLDVPSSLPMPADVVIEQINCLLTLAANPGLSDSGTYRESLLRRLRQTLRQNAADPTFGPTVCADLCGISLRTLHMTFASQGSSFCRELKGIRLQLARSYLEDAKFARKTIAEIAALCGYAHASHFTTTFGKSFGMSPSKYRKTARP